MNSSTTTQTPRLCGYADRWSAVPGQRIAVRASGPAGPATVDIVDLVGPEPEHGLTPPVPVELHLRPVSAGSYLEVRDLTLPEEGGLSWWIRPHLWCARQSLLWLGVPGWELRLDLVDGRPEASTGTGERHLGARLTDRAWVHLTVGWAAGTVRLTQTDADGTTAVYLTGAAPPPGPAVLRLGAGRPASGTPTYAGRIALPALFAHERPPCDIGSLASSLTALDPAALAAATSPALLDQVLGRQAVARWEVDPGSGLVPDLTGDHPGRLVNRPLTGVLGPGGRPAGPTAFQTGPEDLDDAGWPVTTMVTVPDVAPTVLGIRVRVAGVAALVLPLVALPRPDTPPPPGAVAVILPTFTYLAYANHRQRSEAQYVTDYARVTTGGITLSDTDTYLNEHPELGPSLYDRRADGCPAYYSSRLRPVLNVSPDYRWWMTGAPRHFSADLLLLRWLRRNGIVTHIHTDEELHAAGHPLLARYPVVLTGSHPEYVTSAQRAAVDQYVTGGGRVMYLGGNGFYWITGVDPRYPYAIEVRRHSVDGWWNNEPGELTLTSTGETGGLWRDRGLAPQRLLGVGFAGQGWGPAPGYRRLPDSRHPAASWVFAGVDDEEFGRHGLALGGAAGDEVDRAAPELGTAPDTLILATSAGGHSEHYQPAAEDARDGDVRADLTLRWLAGGGAVFSVGSINWITSLADGADNDTADNDVARITRNVLDRFLTTTRNHRMEQSR